MQLYLCSICILVSQKNTAETTSGLRLRMEMLLHHIMHYYAWYYKTLHTLLHVKEIEGIILYILCMI